MGTWYTRHLGDALLAEETLARIRARFRPDCAEPGSRNPAAVFVRYESEGRLHCEVRLYFSPAAATLAEEFGAIPCRRPAADGLSLLAGPEGARTALFPGDRRGSG